MTTVTGLDETEPTDFVWNLGFYFDKWMKNLVHVNKLTSYAYLMLKQIIRVHHCNSIAHTPKNTVLPHTDSA